MPLSCKMAQLVALDEWSDHESLIQKHVPGKQLNDVQVETDLSKPTVVVFLGGICLCAVCERAHLI